jgi:hypothetical protein
MPHLQLQFCVEKQNVETKEVTQDNVQVFEMKNAVFWDVTSYGL